MNWILARLKEPSTWAGISTALAGMAFIPHAADIAQLLPHVGVVVAGVLAILLPENPKKV